jgi:N-acetylglucosaminyl-diphospho-decaprenol L-rhamnosyltransferase
VNYNAGVYLERCVRSLLADTSAGVPPEVVVVDNDSTDGSADALERAVPEVSVLRARANLGFTRGANLGIAATRAPVVAVVNPDAEVARGTAGAFLARLGTEPGLGAIGPRVHDPDGSVYPSARSLPSAVDAVGHGILGLVWRANPFTRRYRQLDADPRVARDVDWLSGSAIWLRRDALDAVGGWDERFFMYMEDVDLCWRLRRAGWRVAYEPAGEVVHVQGLSTSQRPYRMIIEHHRSIGRFAAKRWHGVRRVLLGPAIVYLAVRAAVAMALHALGARRGRRDATG